MFLMGVTAVISLQCFDDADLCLESGGKEASLILRAEVPSVFLLGFT